MFPWAVILAIVPVYGLTEDGDRKSEHDVANQVPCYIERCFSVRVRPPPLLLAGSK
jgi:hypothetical protein